MLGSCWRQALRLARRYCVRRLSPSIVVKLVPMGRRLSPSTVFQLAPVWRVYRFSLLVRLPLFPPELCEAVKIAVRWLRFST